MSMPDQATQDKQFPISWTQTTKEMNTKEATPIVRSKRTSIVRDRSHTPKPQFLISNQNNDNISVRPQFADETFYSATTKGSKEMPRITMLTPTESRPKMEIVPEKPSASFVSNFHVPRLPDPRAHKLLTPSPSSGRSNLAITRLNEDVSKFENDRFSKRGYSPFVSPTHGSRTSSPTSMMTGVMEMKLPAATPSEQVRDQSKLV